MSDKTTRTGVHLPPRVRRGQRPQAATINGILDALGPRTLRIGRNPRMPRDSQAALALAPVGDYTTTTYGIPFVVEHETNPLIIESSDSDADTYPDLVTIHARGIYTVTIAAYITCTTNGAGADPLGVAWVWRNADTSDVVSEIGHQNSNLALASGESIGFTSGGGSDSFDALLDADDTLQVAAGGFDCYVSNVRLYVKLYQLL